MLYQQAWQNKAGCCQRTGSNYMPWSLLWRWQLDCSRRQTGEVQAQVLEGRGPAGSQLVTNADRAWQTDSGRQDKNAAKSVLFLTRQTQSADAPMKSRDRLCQTLQTARYLAHHTLTFVSSRPWDITSALSLQVLCCHLKTYLSNSVTRNYCCHACEVTLSFMDTLIALNYVVAYSNSYKKSYKWCRTKRVG